MNADKTPRFAVVYTAGSGNNLVAGTERNFDSKAEALKFAENFNWEPKQANSVLIIDRESYYVIVGKGTPRKPVPQTTVDWA